MTSSVIASRYANALVDVITGRTAALDPPQAVRELRLFADALASSDELQSALVSPAVPPARKRAVVGRIADVLGLSRVIRNFLYVLIDHRRTPAMRDIAETFELAVDERMGFKRADISSAQRMDDTQRAALVVQLERLTGKRVRPRFAVAPELIGGAVARIGSTVYDGSVRARLDNLGRRLAAE
jgi:F-type H+-transporting ATPase subunit delta